VDKGGPCGSGRVFSHSDSHGTGSDFSDDNGQHRLPHRLLNDELGNVFLYNPVRLGEAGYRKSYSLFFGNDLNNDESFGRLKTVVLTKLIVF
jgi:hypothetical protein